MYIRRSRAAGSRNNNDAPAAVVPPRERDVAAPAATRIIDTFYDMVYDARKGALRREQLPGRVYTPDEIARMTATLHDADALLSGARAARIAGYPGIASAFYKAAVADFAGRMMPKHALIAFEECRTLYGSTPNGHTLNGATTAGRGHGYV